MSSTDALWQKTLIEAGSASIHGLQHQLEQEQAQYGYHHWYGSDPMWLAGKVAQSGASEYEGKGVRSTQPRRPTAAQSALLRQWGAGKKRASFFPQPKGCYGWVWENLKTAYLAADRASRLNRFGEINKRSITVSPFLLSRALRTQGWKILYYAADFREVSTVEKRQLQIYGTYSPYKIAVDARVLNFGPGAAPRDTTGLDKLKIVQFWWGTEAERVGLEVKQGIHFFVGSSGTVVELNWKGNPNNKPSLIDAAPVERRLWHSGHQPGQPTSGLVCVPPGTWT